MALGALAAVAAMSATLGLLVAARLRSVENFAGIINVVLFPAALPERGALSHERDAARAARRGPGQSGDLRGGPAPARVRPGRRSSPWRPTSWWCSASCWSASPRGRCSSTPSSGSPRAGRAGHRTPRRHRRSTPAGSAQEQERGGSRVRVTCWTTRERTGVRMRPAAGIEVSIRISRCRVAPVRSARSQSMAPCSVIVCEQRDRDGIAVRCRLAGSAAQVESEVEQRPSARHRVGQPGDRGVRALPGRTRPERRGGSGGRDRRARWRGRRLPPLRPG